MARGESQLRRELVRRIKGRMRILGLNNGDVARGVGAAHSAVSDWLDETKTSLPSALKLMRMPKVLKCSSDWLLGLSDRVDPPATGADERSTSGYLAALLDIKTAADTLAARRCGATTSPIGADEALAAVEAFEAAEQKKPKHRPTPDPSPSPAGARRNRRPA